MRFIHSFLQLFRITFENLWFIVSLSKYATLEEELWLTLNNGNRLYCHIHRPKKNNRWPGIVLVPGGLNDGVIFDRWFSLNLRAKDIASQGYAVIHFDPEGRGKSDGKEDFGGDVHQNDLHAVLKYFSSLHYVDPNNIGVISFSLGITMATGALAKGLPKNNVDHLPEVILERDKEQRVLRSRATQTMSEAVAAQKHPGPLGSPIFKVLQCCSSAMCHRHKAFVAPCTNFKSGTPNSQTYFSANPKEPYAPEVKYLFDWEGPSNKYEITMNDKVEFFKDYPTSNDTFWSLRQACNYISRIRCGYFRFQCQRDHVQGDYKQHALNLINGASKGNAKWVKCNDSELKSVVEEKGLKKDFWIPSRANQKLKIMRYINELRDKK